MPFVPKNKVVKENEGDHAQTFVEYTLLIGIIVALLIAMMPMIRRGLQGMVKLVADQVGNQEGAEQQGGRAGYLINSYALADIDTNKTAQQRVNVVGYVFDDTIDAYSNSITNLGFTDQSN